VDNDAARIEFLEARLFQHGYRTDTAVVANLAETILEGKISLVLTYLPLEPERIAARGVPVLVMVSDEVPTCNRTDTGNSSVAYLSCFAGSDALVEEIARMIGPGANE
jgi:hypothetical protein